MAERKIRSRPKPKKAAEPKTEVPEGGYKGAYYLKLELENVRCFGPRQTLDLSDGNGKPARWTVLLGDNGTGKTTVLQALAGVMPVEETNIGFRRSDKSGSEQIKFRPYAINKARNFNRNMLIEREVDDSISFDSLIKSKSNLSSFINEIGEVIDMSMEFNVYHRGISQMYIILTGEADEVDFSVPPVYGYGASRVFRKKIPETYDIQVEGLFSEETSLQIDPEKWLLDADYAASREKKKRGPAQRKRDYIIDVLTNVLPDVDAIRFKEPEDPTDIPTLEFKTPYGWVKLDGLSLGYRTMVSWMVDLTARMIERYSDSEDPLAGPAVVLVDEIDLHMHPSWQRRIMGYLSERFPNTQFIVTAHSPLIVQSAGDDANIAVLKRVRGEKGEFDHVAIDQSLGSVRGWRVDQLMTSDLFGLDSARGPEVEALLKERRDLLVKTRLGPKQKQRLAELEELVGNLPTAETKADMDAMDIIRRAAAKMKQPADDS